MKPPTSVIDLVIQYHLEELKIQVDEDMEQDYLAEPDSDVPLNYDQVLNMYMRPVYAEQKCDLTRLKAALKSKEEQVARIENKMSKPENPIKDIAQNLNIGNSVLDNVDKGIVDLKKILEDLLNAK